MTGRSSGVVSYLLASGCWLWGFFLRCSVLDTGRLSTVDVRQLVADEYTLTLVTPTGKDCGHHLLL